MSQAAGSSGSHGSDSTSVTSTLTMSYNASTGVITAYYPDVSHRSGIGGGHINNATARLYGATAAGYFFSPTGVWQ